MSFISAPNSKEGPQNRSSEATKSTIPISPSKKAQAAWNTVKTRLGGKSAPDLPRWWSYSRASEPNQPTVKGEQQPEDEENSHFCESLLGLMERSSRFDYLELAKEEKVEKQMKQSQQEETNAFQSPRAKRLSWTR